MKNRTQILANIIISKPFVYNRVLHVYRISNYNHELLAIWLKRGLNCKANKSVNWLKLAKSIV